MKNFKTFISESRNFGTHSFGMEPPVDQYIKGLDAAYNHAQKEAKSILSRNKSMKGSFGSPESKQGMLIHNGTGDYKGYGMTHYNTSRDRSGNMKTLNLDNAMSHVNQQGYRFGVNLHHGDAHIGNIKSSGTGFSAAHSYKFSSHHPMSHDTAPVFDNHQQAVKYLIAKHKEHLSNETT